MTPKFIRVDGDIIHLNKIIDVNYKNDHTIIYYDNGNSQSYPGGDRRDEIWELMRLALQPKDVGFSQEHIDRVVARALNDRDIGREQMKAVAEYEPSIHDVR